MSRTSALLLASLILLPPEGLFGQGTWFQLTQPTARNLVRLCFLDSSAGWIAGEKGTILKTTNSGQNWTQLVSPTGADIVDIEMNSHLRGWMLANEFSPDSASFGSTIYRTSDGGNGWTPLGHFQELLLCIEFPDSLIGFAGGITGKILRTADGGNTWLDAEIDSFLPWPVRHMDFFSQNYGYAVGGYRDIAGTVWRTTDGGLNWKPKGVASEPVYAIHYFDSLNVICAGGDPDFGAGMARTSDGGETWTYTFLGIWGEVRSMDFRSPSEGWAPLGFAGTYMQTTDGGQTWDWSIPPSNTTVVDVGFTDSIVGYMIGERGTVLKYVHSVVSVTEKPAGTPAKFTLQANYPNPFNPSTTIRYQLPVNSTATLQVYDVLGKEVRTLVRGFLPAGHHVTVWDGRDDSGGIVASGVYFYRLVARTSGGPHTGYVRTRKMLLLR